MPKIVAHKSDWIKLGFKLFSRKGSSGIVVEQMAKKLKCNKSSFYWHFKSKEGFIKEIVQMWSFNDTQLIIDLADQSSDIYHKYQRFINLVFQKDPFLDFVFYLKRYALRHPDIQQSIDQIDNQRLDYVQSLLLELGVAPSEIESKASMLYKYLIGFHEMYRYKNFEQGYMETVKKELNQIIQIEIPQTV